jgi:putative tryptophan/tyrosine transport system substrate-binding protein
MRGALETTSRGRRDDRTKRREFIALLGGAAVWPLAARAQQTAVRKKVVGTLMPYAETDTEFTSRVQALRQELGKLGWKDGSDVEFDERWTGDNMDLVRASVANLVGLNPDVIVVTGGRIIPVLMQSTRSIPVVIPGAPDPVGVGWAKSLSRPGGNITGFSMFELSIVGKMLGILKQVAPNTSRVAFFYNPDNPNTAYFRRNFVSAASALAVEPIIAPIHGLADIARSIEGLAERPNTSIFFAPDATISILREEVIALVGRYRLPAIYSDPVFPRIGGLVFYGPDRIDLFRRAAGYVNRILRGEKPSDLPFQEPTKFQLIVNRGTARALGLELPEQMLMLADDVIE